MLLLPHKALTRSDLSSCWRGREERRKKILKHASCWGSQRSLTTHRIRRDISGQPYTAEIVRVTPMFFRFLLVDVSETQAARRVTIRQLCCNYTDDGSTRMHRVYGNLVK